MENSLFDQELEYQPIIIKAQISYFGFCPEPKCLLGIKPRNHLKKKDQILTVSKQHMHVLNNPDIFQRKNSHTRTSNT